MPALTGLKVLDLSRLLPGPYLTLLLADLGAEVTKVEDPEGGDYVRHVPPMVELPGTGEVGALFAVLNRGKRSLALDLRQAGDRERLLALVEGADVLVESFRPGVMERLGLDLPTLHARNPKLLLLSLSGWGQEGPLAKRAGHDLGYLARTGALGLGGAQPGLPAFPGVQMADVGGALLAAVALLAALHERQRTGVGKRIDVALADAGLAFALPALAQQLLLAGKEEVPARGDDLLSGGVPSYGLYATSDGGTLAVAALEPKFWLGLCAALGRPDLETGGLVRGEEAKRVRAELSGIFQTKTLAEWEAFFAPLDLCVEPVREGSTPLGDAHLAARGFVEETPWGRAMRMPLTDAVLAGGVPPKLGGG